MVKSGSIIHYSLFAALVSGAVVPAGAAVRVHNASRSYAGAYNQVANMRAEVEAQNVIYSDIAPTTGGATVVNTGDATVTLPVRVADSDMAQKIVRGDPAAPVAMDNLQSCAMIYPNGEFAWDTPNVGMHTGGDQTCVAVVEMRGYQMGANGDDLVLARANLAAGDAIKCNISDFPESSYTEDAGRVTFPADREPTVDDVVSVMNEEQKQNAGFKIAAGSVIGAIGGNMVGKAAPGQEGLFGTNKDKIQTSLIGAVTGAGIAAGGSYAGKVGGDVILSTGVNAAAGSMIGNMVASAGSGSALRIEDCTIDGKETSCLWGVLVKSKEADTDKVAFYNIEKQTLMLCTEDNGSYTQCKLGDGIDVKLDANKEKTVNDLTPKDITDLQGTSSAHFYIDDSDKTAGKKIVKGSDTGADVYYQVHSYRVPTTRIPAMVAGVKDKMFGLSYSAWTKWRAANPTATIYGRNGNGTAYAIENDDTVNLANFHPINLGADSGGIIDYSNKARMQGTLTGAGLGGAMGAFTAYQGAQKDIDDRWVAAVREYKDSLAKVYCATGTRFLSKYNDIASIPAPVDTTE